jgi:hypothetical protein
MGQMQVELIKAMIDRVTKVDGSRLPSVLISEIDLY